MIKKIHYPDGFSYVDIEPMHDLCPITIRINSYEDLWMLAQIVDVCNHNGSVPRVTIPCLPDAQADKRFNSSESSGLKLVLDFLRGMDADFEIYHPHNPEIVEALLPSALILPPEEFDIDDDFVILSPDAGAYKWVSKVYSSHKGDIVSASKSRSWVDNKSILSQQLPNFPFLGRKVAIVDDIMVGGGTFLGLYKLLVEAGVLEVHLYVSHITVQRLNKLVFDSFKTVNCTNSKFDEYFAPYGQRFAQPSNLNVIKLFSPTEIKTE